MPILVQREAFDEEQGFNYYLNFNPPLPGLHMQDQVCSSVAVEALLSVSETGDLANCSFVLPKPCRSEQALTFIRRQSEIRVAAPKVYIDVPGAPGDALANAIANLEMDLAGRIVSMTIRWIPEMAPS